MLVHRHDNISARVCHVSILRLVKGGLVLSPFTARCRPKPNVKKLTDATTKEEEKRHYITYTSILNLLCLALTLVNVRNNVNKTYKDVSAKQLRPSSVF